MKAKEISLMNANRVSLGQVVPLRTPLVVYVEPSRVCNFKCEFCFKVQEGVQGSAILSVPLAKKMVDDISEFPDKLKMIRICGFGEPLVNPNIVEIVKYMHERNCAEKIVLVTNGSLLTTDSSRNLVHYLDQVVISVNGLSDEQFRKFTGAKINQERYYNGVKELCHYAEDSNCTVCAKIHNEAVTEKADLEKFYELYGEICDEVTVEKLIPLFPEIPFEIEDSSCFRYAGLKKIQKKCCVQIFKSMQICANGDVVPCCADYKYANKIGNFENEHLIEIWNGTLLKTLQMHHLDLQKDVTPFCKDCRLNDYSEVDNIDENIDDIKKRMKF